MTVDPSDLMAAALHDLADQLDELSCLAPAHPGRLRDGAAGDHDQALADLTDRALVLVQEGAAGPVAAAVPRLLVRGLVALRDTYQDAADAADESARPTRAGG